MFLFLLFLISFFEKVTEGVSGAFQNVPPETERKQEGALMMQSLRPTHRHKHTGPCIGTWETAVCLDFEAPWWPRGPWHIQSKAEAP